MEANSAHVHLNAQTKVFTEQDTFVHGLQRLAGSIGKTVSYTSQDLSRLILDINKISGLLCCFDEVAKQHLPCPTLFRNSF